MPEKIKKIFIIPGRRQYSRKRIESSKWSEAGCVVQAELERLRRMKQRDISQQTAEKLARISPAPIDRLLRSKKEQIKDGRRHASYLIQHLRLGYLDK